MSVLFNIPSPDQAIAPPLPNAVVDADHYLSPEWLDAFRARPYQLEEAKAFLRETFPRIAEDMFYPAIGREDVVVDGEPTTRIYFSTGGWSGAEELIGVVLSHFWMRHLYVQWRRGGHYVFEIPISEGRA